MRRILSLAELIKILSAVLGAPLGKISRALALPIYQSYLKARRGLANLPIPIQQSFWHFFLYRSLVQGVVILATLFVTATNIQASGGTGGEEIGKKSLLYALLNSDNELVEETAEDNSNANNTKTYMDSLAVSAPIDIFPDFEEPGTDNETYVEENSAFLTPEVIVKTARTRTETENYTVRPGDTISSIAELFGVSINTILWENKLTVRSTIRPEQTLVIPPVSGISHKIAKGDTVAKIASRYKTDSEKIKEFNKLADDGSLKVGEKIFVPDGTPPPPPPPPPRRIASPKTILIPTTPPNTSVRYVWPTAVSRITQYFHWRHPGVDIAGPSGTPIYAADDGIVEYAGWGKGYGLQVVINHGDGVRTRYAHSSKLLVNRGDQVSKGQNIALMGSTGRSTGPHIHFEIYINGKRVNPLDYTRK